MKTRDAVAGICMFLFLVLAVGGLLVSGTSFAVWFFICLDNFLTAPIGFKDGPPNAISDIAGIVSVAGVATAFIGIGFEWLAGKLEVLEVRNTSNDVQWKEKPFDDTGNMITRGLATEAYALGAKLAYSQDQIGWALIEDARRTVAYLRQETAKPKDK